VRAEQFARDSAIVSETPSATFCPTGRSKA